MLKTPKTQLWSQWVFKYWMKIEYWIKAKKQKNHNSKQTSLKKIFNMFGYVYFDKHLFDLKFKFTENLIVTYGVALNKPLFWFKFYFKELLNPIFKQINHTRWGKY